VCGCGRKVEIEKARREAQVWRGQGNAVCVKAVCCAWQQCAPVAEGNYRLKCGRVSKELEGGR